jgi:hypothetical protein
LCQRLDEMTCTFRVSDIAHHRDQLVDVVGLGR